MTSESKEISNDRESTDGFSGWAANTDSVVKKPLFTLAHLEKISNGNQVFLASMVNIFIEYMPVYVRDIRSAIVTQNCDLLKHSVHKIKPTIYDMEINSLKEVIKELTLLANTHKCTPKIHELVNLLDQTVSDIANQLKREFSANSGSSFE